MKMKCLIIRLKLEVGLGELMKKELFDEIKFWGRIRGKINDYYIAMGLKFGRREYPRRCFYVASGKDFFFKKLPALQPLFAEKVELLTEEFEGEPNKELFQVTEVTIIPAKAKVLELPKEEGGEEEEEETIGEVVEENSAANADPLNDEAEPQEGEDLENLEKPVEEFEPERREEKELTCLEIDRLAFIVRAIEWDCAIIPRGSFRYSLDHKFQYDPVFQGLTLETAVDRSQWLHFRDSTNEDISAKLLQPESMFDPDIMDSIKFDQPRSLWSIIIDPTDEFVTARNGYWAGFMSFHRLGSQEFGYGYFGDGLKNAEFGLTQ